MTGGMGCLQNVGRKGALLGRWLQPTMTEGIPRKTFPGKALGPEASSLEMRFYYLFPA